jgi:ATP-dependent DNA helicase RecG
VFLRELRTSVINIRGISDRKAEKLAKTGIISISDLLRRYPKNYEDRSKIIPLRDYNKQRNVCTAVRVVEHKQFFFKGETRWKIIIEDDTARAVIPCFFQAGHLVKRMAVGSQFKICGHFEKNRYGELQSTHFDFEDAALNKNSSKFGCIIPVYYYSDAAKNSLLQTSIKSAIEQYGAYIENELPQSLIKRAGLFEKSHAVMALHFPSDENELETAKKTLIYEELFYLEIIVCKRSILRRSGQREIINSGGKQTYPSPLQQRLIDRIPFSLTKGQTDAVCELNRDMESVIPMNRLLQGDVGSGKTLVALFAALLAVERGGQTALMAPTELLARQHAENAAQMLEPLGVRVAFLTGNIKTTGRTHLLNALADGEIDIIIGTHALFSNDVTYKCLSFVIIDEQHRFGVTQRQTILAKGKNCDLLMMSATPIPRTLAMTLFGDMDISVIRDMPPGRKPVITHLANEANETKVYEFVRNELEKGRQAYFVYPLIESSDDLDLKDAESMYERLSKTIFPKLKCALLHSRIDDNTKRIVMRNFKNGELDILVATSVVEVGIDVPNATCMVIEHADRFGLSALHQLRGRVGRGDFQSYCFLIYSKQDVQEKYANMRPELLSDDERTKEGRRLMVMLKNNNGFDIAEEDLKFRGPGDIIGTEQSGFIRFGIADPARDIDMLQSARNDAFSLLENDPALSCGDNQIIEEVLKRSPPFSV